MQPILVRHRGEEARAASHGSRTMTVTGTNADIDADDRDLNAPRAGTDGVLRLQATPTAEAPRVRWDESTVDNEGMGRKKSKVCCIYHKPHKVRQPGEPRGSDSSSSSSSSDSDSDSDSPNDYERPNRATRRKMRAARRRQRHERRDAAAHGGGDHDHDHDHACNGDHRDAAADGSAHSAPLA
ncbi:hypothetical protein CXG81DRAFT_24604 [Caulochytrium protostelioides]|uniref:Type 1 phosphatases regulator n=1 Tax=Caulochytrium protostelioides TaxID=1555241 RepID=A0A4P9XBD0_9FUNG|nr:hypothetical protein CXG81DRAFT_24604 [Caulochytrium protostelioides]|eukprot:RKP02724.1 hypothetical protein CXG81DRAFT_24604 [Caulochytrium protostelioides]